MPSLLALIPGNFAIRLYGKRWLKLSRPHTGPSEPLGWRAVSWTANLEDACKWTTRAAALHFANTGLYSKFEIVDLETLSGMTPVNA